MEYRGYYEVVFAVKATGARVSKFFDSPYSCERFINKAKRSKRIRLISYPTFYN